MERLAVSNKSAWWWIVAIASGLLLIQPLNSQSLDDYYDYSVSLHYDGRLGPIRVGTIEADLSIKNDIYELEGSITGAGPIKRLLKWQGEFASKGVFEEGRPVTQAYLLLEREENKGKVERKTVLVHGSTTYISETGKPRVEKPRPEGIDMMSAIFANSQCADEMVVYDGEDPFVIKLKSRDSNKKLRQGRKYFSGETELCRYEFIYDEDEVRKVDIWIAEIQGRGVPVRIRIRVPVIPDGVFKLRMPQPDEEEGEDSTS